MSVQILVYADWEALGGITRLGTLRASIIRNKESFSFSYEEDWLTSNIAQQIDPQLQLYAGEQYENSVLGSGLESLDGYKSLILNE